jgi:ABC-type multidrug transport system fused ATPase/permease subunit
MYAAGVGLQLPMFLHVDASLMFGAIFGYFISTLCLALCLSAVIASTRVAVMVGFVFLAIGLVVQAHFALMGAFVFPLLYTPWVVPSPVTTILNLYPPFAFAKIIADFTTVTAPYIPIGGVNTTRNRYTVDDFMDGYYRYGTPSPQNAANANLTSCISDPVNSATARCNNYVGSCPYPRTFCPDIMCSSDWTDSITNKAQCTTLGGYWINDASACVCRWVISSDYELLLTMLGASVLYFFLAWSLGQIFTYEHGRPERCGFCCSPKYWGCTRGRKRQDGVFMTARDEEVLAEEGKIQRGDRDGCTVVVTGLRKDFKKNVAVNGLSFALETGKCFALLGHNGAGKTTGELSL